MTDEKSAHRPWYICGGNKNLVEGFVKRDLTYGMASWLSSGEFKFGVRADGMHLGDLAFGLDI